MARQAEKNPRTSTSYSTLAVHSLKVSVLQGHWSGTVADSRRANSARSVSSARAKTTDAGTNRIRAVTIMLFPSLAYCSMIADSNVGQKGTTLGQIGHVTAAMCTILRQIRQELKANANPRTKASGQTFFKEDVTLYGVKTPVVAKIAKRYFVQIKEMDKDGVFALCEQLWQSGYMEESFIACQWAYCLRDRFAPGDFRVLARWVKRYVTNWASCDTLCNHTIAAFVEMYPKHLADLKKWARSKNRWVRRAATVTLIVPARNGRFLDDVLEIADILLLDDDDLVQKGYGWMLKAASQSHRKKVFQYVIRNKCNMPRTALRYAIEKMPAAMKQKAMVRDNTPNTSHKGRIP